MELISKDLQQTTIKFETVELGNIRRILTGLIVEYDHVNEEIIGVSKEYIQKLESEIYALREEVISE